jgi:hypothetical protein
VNQSPKLAVFLACFFALPFCGFGWFAMKTGLHQLSRGATQPEWIMSIFGLIFFGCGTGLIAVALFSIPRIKRQNRVQAEHPESPWMWRPDWAEGRANSKMRSTMKNAWTIALFWNLVSFPSAHFIPKQTYLEDPKTLALLIFPLVGIGLLIWAIRETLRCLEFGKTYFQMTDVPIAVGHELRGAIQARFPKPPQHGIRLKLSCVNIVLSRNSKDQTTRQSILWRDEHSVAPQGLFASPMGTTIPVSFDIPPDARQTDSSDPHNAIVWLLQAEADVPGVDYRDVFEIPVFRTKGTPSTPEAQVFHEYRPAVQAPVAPTILVTPTSEGTRFYFPAARNKSFAAGTTMFLALWTGVLMLILRLKAPIIFPLAFGLFEALLVYIVLQLWFGTSTATVNRGGVRYRSGLFNAGPFREINSSQISAVQTVIRSQQGGATGTPYYDIQLIQADGKKITLGQTLRDKNEAEWLVLQMSDALGLQSSKAVAATAK